MLAHLLAIFPDTTLCEFWKARKLMLWKRDNPHGNIALKIIDLEYQFYAIFN